MSFSRADGTLRALILGFVVLTLAVGGSIWLTQRQQQSYNLVAHALYVQNRLGIVMSRLQDAEIAERGFLLTRRDQFLEPYEATVANLDGDLHSLQTATVDSPRQQAAMVTLRALSDRRMALLREELARARDGGDVAAHSTTLLDDGKQVMDQIRLVIAGMGAEEHRLLMIRIKAARSQGQVALLVLLASVMGSLALGVLVFRDGRRRLATATQARDELALANAQLQAEAGSRAEAEAKVRQMQKMEAIGQLTGGIAHDFNNMLAIVLGSLDLARRRLRTAPDKAAACIDNAIGGTERAAQLTSRLLAFSRQQPLAPRALDANKLLGGMSDMLRRAIGEAVQMETILAGGLWRTYADPGELENAILNLCINARDAMADGGRLTIETANASLDDTYAANHSDVEPGQYVLVSVTDTGVGMATEVIDRAFDPFYTTKAVGKGTGLGLSQTHGFVKQSGGHVKIYSERGVGTTVKLYLPRSLKDEDGAEPEAPIMTDLPRGRPEEIIYVVEDEQGVRHLTVDVLRELGYTVVQASEGAEALSGLALEPRVDLLFTDVIMPGMTGRQLADLARESRPDLKVLYTTGYTKNAIVHNGVLDADVAFLPKPFTVEQLAVKVRRVLDGGGANRPDRARKAPADS